jgi:hypothetical protein
VTRRICESCRFFVPTGSEDSGILLPDRSGPWLYTVGTCEPPAPQYDTPDPTFSHPVWRSSCLAYKARRGKALQVLS